MDVHRARQAIIDSIPDLEIIEIKANDVQGWDSFVCVVNGNRIFRFPLREDVRLNLAKEIYILPVLAECLDVRIPDTQHRS